MKPYCHCVCALMFMWLYENCFCLSGKGHSKCFDVKVADPRTNKLQTYHNNKKKKHKAVSKATFRLQSLTLSLDFLVKFIFSTFRVAALKKLAHVHDSFKETINNDKSHLWI